MPLLNAPTSGNTNEQKSPVFAGAVHAPAGLYAAAVPSDPDAVTTNAMLSAVAATLSAADAALAADVAQRQTQAQVDQRIAQALAPIDNKPSVAKVLLYTGSTPALSGLTIGALTFNADEAVLVANTDAGGRVNNGPWIAANGAWARRSNEDSNGEITPLAQWGVEGSSDVYRLQGTTTPVIGVDPIEIKIAPGASNIVGSNSIEISGGVATAKAVPTSYIRTQNGIEFYEDYFRTLLPYLLVKPTQFRTISLINVPLITDGNQPTNIGGVEVGFFKPLAYPGSQFPIDPDFVVLANQNNPVENGVYIAGNQNAENRLFPTGGSVVGVVQQGPLAGRKYAAFPGEVIELKAGLARNAILFGDALANTFTIPHTLGYSPAAVRVEDATTGAEIACKNVANASSVTIGPLFFVPALNALRVVVS